jgi:hypothetical protein
VHQAREQLGLTWKYVAEFEAEAEKGDSRDADRRGVRKICDQIWKPLTDTATDRSKTIAANRDAALTELFVDVDTNANIAAPGR